MYVMFTLYMHHLYVFFMLVFVTIKALDNHHLAVVALIPWPPPSEGTTSQCEPGDYPLYPPHIIALFIHGLWIKFYKKEREERERRRKRENKSEFARLRTA